MKRQDQPSDGSKPLDPKREKFVAHLLNGDSYTEAYRKDHPNASQRTAEVRGSEWADSEVKVRLSYLQKQTESSTVLTAKEKREKLASIVRNIEVEVKDVIAAMKVDNDMSGDNAPQKVEHSGTVEVMDALANVRNRKRA